jgi:tetratricopeptide (TPR) repeat protein
VRKVVILFTALLFVLVGCNNNQAFTEAMEEGKALLERKEYDKALESFQLAINEDEKNVEANSLYSMAEKMKNANKALSEGKADEAIRLFEEVEKVDGGYQLLQQQAKEQREQARAKKEQQEQEKQQVAEVEKAKEEKQVKEAKKVTEEKQAREVKKPKEEKKETSKKEQRKSYSYEEVAAAIIKTGYIKSVEPYEGSKPVTIEGVTMYPMKANGVNKDGTTWFEIALYGMKDGEVVASGLFGDKLFSLYYVLFGRHENLGVGD